MRTYLISLGVDVWYEMLNGYEKPDVLVERDDKIKFSYNAKAMNAILSGLS